MIITIDVLMIFLRSRLAWSMVQIPWLLNLKTNPTHTVIAAIASIKGLNHEYPSPPQYNVSDSAAPVDTDAIPNITNTTDGRQHKEAINEELATIFHDFCACFCSARLAVSSSSIHTIELMNYKKHCLIRSQYLTMLTQHKLQIVHQQTVQKQNPTNSDNGTKYNST